MMKNNLPLWIIVVSLTIILISIPVQKASAEPTAVVIDSFDLNSDPGTIVVTFTTGQTNIVTLDIAGDFVKIRDVSDILEVTLTDSTSNAGASAGKTITITLSAKDKFEISNVLNSAAEDLLFRVEIGGVIDDVTANTAQETSAAFDEIEDTTAPCVFLVSKILLQYLKIPLHHLSQ